jgi:hypothetical protein
MTSGKTPSEKRRTNGFERKQAEAAGPDDRYEQALKGAYCMSYVVRGLDPSPFREYFGLPDDKLAARGIIRMAVTKKPSFPCRITLEDRDIGENVLLLNHVSHDVANPYRAAHAIFVTEGAESAADYVDQVPPVFATRVLSLRGFDAHGMMADALLTQPGEAEAGIRKLFENPGIAVIHAHNAARGCFSARIERI